jgi:hypothetical protein
MLEDKSGDYPHVLLATAHDCRLESPDTILLGELAAMITIIRSRMRQKGFRDETVFPIRLAILALLWAILLLNSDVDLDVVVHRASAWSLHPRSFRGSKA